MKTKQTKEPSLPHVVFGLCFITVAEKQTRKMSPFLD